MQSVNLRFLLVIHFRYHAVESCRFDPQLVEIPIYIINRVFKIPH